MNKVKSFYVVITFLIGLLLSYIVSKNANILFFMNIIICLAICLKAKISIFSLKSILINYVLISVFFQFNTGKSYGILELNIIPLYYEKMMWISIIYNLIMYVFIEKTKVLEFEKEKFVVNKKVSMLASYLCSIIAIMSSIIAFPSIPFTETTERFNALLPGNAWNHVTVISLLLAYPKFSKSYFVKFSYAFCFLWFLLHGERVDMIGLSIFILCISAAKSLNIAAKDKYKTYLKYGLIIFLLVLVLLFIGEIRGGNKNVGFEQLTRKLLIQNTAADVGYVYNSSIHHVKEEGLLYGKTYLTYIFESIPLLNHNYGADKLLEEYYSPGGILILSEPYMNFGVIGVIIFTVFEMFVFYILLKNNNNKYCYFVYLYLLASVFRISWYGIRYIETGMIYILPLLYLMTRFIDKWVSRNAKKVNNSNSSSV